MGIMWEMERAKEVLSEHDMATIAEYMDNEIREELHRQYAGCNDVYFLSMYIMEHYAKYGEDFVVC